MNTAATIAFVGLVVFLAHYLAGVFSRTRIPDVLWLFVLGLLLGPGLGVVTPESMGGVGPVFTTITLVFILFESGTQLRLDSLRRSLRGAVGLTALNFVATTSSVALLVSVATDLGPLRSLLLGSILGGTSSAAVASLVPRLRLRAESSAVLVLESALSDVFTLAVPLALLGAYELGAVSVGETIGRFTAALVLALLLGTAGGFAWSVLLARVRTLANSIFTTPAFVFVLYGAVELLGYSGPIAALAFGITLGNVDLLRPPILERMMGLRPHALNDTERVFFAEAVFLLRTFFFLYIGISVPFAGLDLLALGLLTTLLLFAIRIPVVRLTADPATPKWDASVMSVMIPKGLGAAVLASVPLQRGMSGGDVIQVLTFSVIVGTTVISTVLLVLLERTALGRVYARCFPGPDGDRPPGDALRGDPEPSRDAHEEHGERPL